MKKLFSLLAVLSVCFLSCTDKSSTTSTNADSQAEKNRAHSAEVYQAMETGDVSKVDSFLDKDIVDHESNIHGLDSLKKLFANMHNSIRNLKFEKIAEATDGDYHLAYTRMTGTTTDASMGIPAGTKLDMMSVDVVKIKDGKAVEHWGYSDRNDMMKMMEMGRGMPPMDHKMDSKMQNAKDNNMKDTMQK